jgi:hypothetical protein
VVFLAPRANAELVPKFHVALHASHAALPIITIKFNALIAVEPQWLRGDKVPYILYYISTIITIISLY